MRRLDDLPPDLIQGASEARRLRLFTFFYTRDDRCRILVYKYNRLIATYCHERRTVRFPRDEFAVVGDLSPLQAMRYIAHCCHIAGPGWDCAMESSAGIELAPAQV